MKPPRQWPLVEVIAEFHFLPQAWQERTPDLLHEKIKQSFPHPGKRRMVTHHLAWGPNQQTQSREDFDRHQFFSEDRLRLVQVDRGLLSVNHLPPYSQWESFAPLVSSVIEAFGDVNPTAAPSEVMLTYINRIELPGQQANIDDYLEFRPVMREDFIQCGCMATHLWPEGNAVVMRQMQTQPIEGDCLPVVLILGARRSALDLTNCLTWLGSAHEKLNAEFKASITERTYAMFVEAKEQV